MATVSVQASHLNPEFVHEIGRVNVILGANGTGKSSLLARIQLTEELRQSGLLHRRLIDGGRVLRPVGQSTRPRQESVQATLRTSEQLLGDHNTNHDTAQHQAELLLEALCKDHHRRSREHSVSCTQWHAVAPTTPFPHRAKSQLERFTELFEETFPNIKLTIDPDAVNVTCTRRTQTYQPNTFSTGEKQVFLLLGKFIVDDDPSLFLVDEPEQNLNPRLAERFWTIIEGFRANSTFIYSTHAFHFALRPRVDRIFLLTPTGSMDVTAIEKFHSLPAREREEFLGCIPSLVTNRKVLVTEGAPGSADEGTYRYILQDPSIKVLPLGDCAQVRFAVAGQGVWEAITAGIRICGVIDSDFRPQNEIESYRSDAMAVLKQHEVESVLCHPDAVAELSSRMWPVGSRVTADQIRDALVEVLRQTRMPVALRRAVAILGRVAPTLALTAEEMTAIGNDIQATTVFDQQLALLKMRVAELSPSSIIAEELEAIDAAIASGNVDEVLRLAPGKAVLGKVRQLLRLGKTDVLAAYEQHIPAADLAAFEEVRKPLLAMFNAA